MQKNFLISVVRRSGVTRLILAAIIIGGDYFLLLRATKNRVTLIPLLALMAVGIFIALWGMKNLLLPRTHGLFRKMAALGNPAEIEQYFSESDECGQTIYRHKNLHMTRQYTAARGNRLYFFKTDSLMWAYRHVTINKRNGVESHRDYYLMLGVAGRSKLYMIGMSDEKATECLEAIGRALPHTLVGFSPERSALFRKKNGEFEAHWQALKRNQNVQV